MLENLRNIGRPFKGNALLMLAWIVCTAVISVVFFYLPVGVGELLLRITNSEAVVEKAAMVSIIWMLAVMIVSIIYGVAKFHVRLSLFGSASKTAGLGIIGLSNIMEGGAAGILLIIPSIFYLVFKLFYAGFIGYISLMAALTGSVIKHITPSV